MKRGHAIGCITLGFAVVVLLLSGCGDGRSNATHESSEIRRISFPVPDVPTVEISASNGIVTVRGQEDLTEVQVTMTLRNLGASLEQAESRVDEMIVHTDRVQDRIVLGYAGTEQPESIREHGSVEFEVIMPPRADISIEVGNGSITASDIVGRFDARTNNGEIDAARMSGMLRLDASNGRIRMTETDGTVDAKTGNGDIAFSGRLGDAEHRIETGRGDLEIELPIDLSITIDAVASAGIETDDLRLEGDTDGEDWVATLNAPAAATLILVARSGRIELRGVQ